MKASICKPWLKHYNVSEDAAIPAYGSCYLAIKSQYHRHTTYTAMDYYGKKVSYREFFSKIDTVSTSLVAAGVKKGDIITLLLLNAPDAIILFYALNKIGAVANLVSGTLPEELLIFSIASTQSRLIVSLDLFVEKLNRIRNQIPSVEKVILCNLTDNMPWLKGYLVRFIKHMNFSKSPPPIFLCNGIVSLTVPLLQFNLLMILTSQLLSCTPAVLQAA